jgi:uncharacterized membrane protein YdjX (TVP38/TMEM64 family)
VSLHLSLPRETPLTCLTRYHRLPGGWAIPIGVIFVVSFPPLFGGEVVCLLCGLVWGLWIGFAIVCAGTFLGEVSWFCHQARTYRS